ncbi:hypothetical protein DQ384_21470 [Sphaerisporangium album]|uniref:Uncharacterized protein n=1 Tax=Sphaerisporangium album TaxID=509200 RepID=A0A367FEY5_9ACTN|nr:hypothetical protein DQ384_21470 [Sphaerisporangium album]
MAGVLDQPLAGLVVQDLGEIGENAPPVRALLRRVAGEDLGGDEVLETGTGVPVELPGAGRRGAEYVGKLLLGDRVAGEKLQHLAFVVRQRGDGVDRHAPQIAVGPLVGRAGLRIVLGSRRHRAPAQGLPPGQGVEPGTQPPRIGQGLDVRLGRDQGVAQRDLRAVGAPEHERGVRVEAFGVVVVEGSEGTRIAGAECLDQDAVIHVTDSKGFVTACPTVSRTMTCVVLIP